MFVYHNKAFDHWFFPLWVSLPVVLCLWLFLRSRFLCLRKLEAWFWTLHRRQWAAMGTLFLIVFGANLLLACIHYPQPKIHDEFAYQLAADTYAKGRLTNPTHPFWEHFETFHVLSQPTYMAKYPPGSGLALGLGQWLTGHSIVGFWAVLGAGVAAMFWMLKSWMPDRWAFLGCLLVAINPYWLTNWGQTWWGGAVPFLAGSLLFGATKRLADRMENLSAWQVSVYSSLFAIGASMLAISRPFEGLIACIVCACIMGWNWVSKWADVSKRLVPLVLPSLTIGAAAIAFMGWNNYAVTGSVLKLPYSLHSQRYSASTMWLFNDPPPIPEYRLPRMRKCYINWSRARHEDAQSWPGYIKLVKKKIKHCIEFYPLFGGICLFPLLMVKRRQERWVKFCFLTIGLLIGMHLLTTFSSVYPHYVAPFAGLFYFLVFHGMRCWRIVARKHPKAAYVLPALVCWSILRFVFLVAFTLTQVGTTTARVDVERKLSTVDGNHLVVVEYPDEYSTHKEWVFNRADIDNSRIVWAHSLSDAKNQKLIEYFQAQGRHVWQWYVGDEPKPLIEGIE